MVAHNNAGQLQLETIRLGVIYLSINYVLTAD